MSNHYVTQDFSFLDPELSLYPSQQPSHTDTPVDTHGQPSLFGSDLHSDFERQFPTQNAGLHYESCPGQIPMRPTDNETQAQLEAHNTDQAPYNSTGDLEIPRWTSVGRDEPLSGQSTSYSESSSSPDKAALSVDSSAQGGIWSSAKDAIVTDTFDNDVTFTPSHSSHPSLSHHTSSASLASLGSSWNDHAFGDQYGLSATQRGLLVDFPNDYTAQQVPQRANQPHSLSRQSSRASFVFNDLTVNNSPQQYPSYASIGYNANTIPNSGYLVHTPLAKHATNTFATPGKTGRQRSLSRVQPYTRHARSISNASYASSDLYGESGSTSLMMYGQVSNDSPASLARDMNKVTLHHRRTSSRGSVANAMKKIPPTACLSRPGRSASMSVLKTAPHDWSDAPPLPHMAEGAIEATLRDRAVQCLALSSTAQQDKARTEWVRNWLKLAYTTAPGFTVPRQGLYHSYQQACRDYGMREINPASFGKAVRAAYPGIRTRRLGVRGDSKYHYQSLRPAMMIECQRLNDFGNSAGQWHMTGSHGPVEFRLNHPSGSMDIHQEEEEEDVEDSELDDEYEDNSIIHHRTPSLDLCRPAKTGNHARHGSGSKELNAPSRSRPAISRRHTTSIVRLEAPASTLEHSTYTQSRISDRPGYPQTQEVLALCNDLNETEIQSFWTDFSRHQQDLVDCAESGNFDDFEDYCRGYWTQLPGHVISNCHDAHLSDCISTAMAVTYNQIIGSLLSSATRPTISSSQVALQNLGQSLVETMEVSLSAFNGVFKSYKVELAIRFAHLIARAAELLRLSGTILPILTNREVISRMTDAWSTLDIKSISDQCALALSCDQAIVDRILSDMAGLLRHVEEMSEDQGGTGPIKKLANWLDNVLSQVQASSEFPEATMARIPAKVSFITSQIMRQLTLDSHPAFGQFQLLKTWIEDYISILSVKSTCLVADPAASTMFELSVVIPPLQAGRGADLATAVPPRSLPVGYNVIDPALLDSTTLAPAFQDFHMGTPTPVGRAFPNFSFPKNEF